MAPKLIDDEVGSLTPLVRSWMLSLRAANKRPKTLETYGDAARLLEVFLRDKLGITRVANITSEHIGTFIEDQLTRHKPATASIRYRALQQLFGWLVTEGELSSNPMATMEPPRVPESPVPVIKEGDLKLLLSHVNGRKDFDEVRDNAIIRLFIDTGIRRGELTGIKVDDIDPDNNTVTVHGKNERTRTVAFEGKTALALDRYMRMRRRHRLAGSDELWLGRRGPLTANGITQVVKRRWAEAGLTKVGGIMHPHRFRHTWASFVLSEGMEEGDVMKQAGWRTRSMLDKYGASVAEERSVAARKRVKIGDRF